MGIIYCEKDRTFTLQTKNTTYQMQVDRYGFLLHLYYGKKTDGCMDYLLTYYDRGFSGNPYDAGEDRTYSMDTLPQEFPCYGNGDFRSTAFAVENADGSMSCDLRYKSHKIFDGKYNLEGLPAVYASEEEAQTLEILMEDPVTGVKVVLLYGVLPAQDIITRSVCVKNESSGKIYLNKIESASLDFLYGDYELLTFYGRHAMERNVQRVPVVHGTQKIGSVRGTSSHQYNPAMILCDPAATEDFGSCYGFCFAYSGNFVAGAQKDQRGLTRVQMGINPVQFRYTLAAGEAFFAPQVLMSYSSEGFTGLTHQYHDLIREHICRGAYKHAKRPVLINNWEATYFDFDKEKIVKIAQQAHELGIEMLVLDDGWFGKRDSDNSGLGDWYTNEKKMDGTMGELGDEIHALGMKFGLWFEPEMINEDSDLYRAHPDWALRIPGREPNRGRDQLVLDMSRSEVREYLYERISSILNEAKIDYVKWDMNRSVCDLFGHELPPERMGELYHRFVLGVYELKERLLAHFPRLLLEGCSGGGGRFDAGMLYYAPQIWCSDNTDAINRLTIQYGTSFFYPAGTMGAHVSAVPNHQTGRVTPFTTRGHVALSGTFGYELDLNLVSTEEKQMVKEQLAEFDRYYELTHEGDYYRLAKPGEALMAWGFVAKDQSRAMVTVVSTDVEGNPLAQHVSVKGLAEGRNYRCSYNGIVHDGSVWNSCGLTLKKVLKEYESLLIEWTEV